MMMPSNRFRCSAIAFLLLCGGVSCLYLWKNKQSGVKKGISSTHWSLLCGDFNVFRGHVSWWYDWEATPDYWTTLAQFSGCGPLLENRAAMIWGWPSDDYVVKIPAEASVVLGYNEPNMREQANITARKAARHWPAIQAAAGNRTLVSPCPVLQGYPQTYWQWMDEFLQHCHGCRFDYMAAHIYQCNPDRDMEFLEKIYQKYKKKIWVTEFACPYQDSLQAQMNYMKAILPRLEAAPFVVRYAWFVTRWKGDWFIPQAASLMEQNSSTLTPLGEYYLHF